MTSLHMRTLRNHLPRTRLRGVVLAAVLASTALAVFVVVTPLVSQYGVSDVDFALKNSPPSAAHLLGTDSAGRDLLIRLAVGLRVSISIAAVGAVCTGALGLLIGLLAGGLGGWWDRALMRLVDMVSALPSLLLGILVVALLRGSPATIVIALLITHWTPIARVVRAEVISRRRAEYMHVAQLAGVPRPRAVARHLLPLAFGQALTNTILLLPHAIWFEATLTFLGVGLPPDSASLGSLFADAQASLLLGSWWLLVFPGCALVAATLSISVLGQTNRQPTLRAGGAR